MRAFALDALTAALSCDLVASVYVVTDEAGLAEEVAAMGCTVLPDRGEGDLNRALAGAVADVADAAGGPVAVTAMLGDLPCLTSSELTGALAWAAGRPAFVADAAGTGTTLLTVGDRADFVPHFGTGSARAHASAGYRPVPLALPGLRQDVDTAEDLAAAISLGAGVRTRAVLGFRD